MENYIDRIKLLKSKQKMTNQQLAEVTGIPIGTLSKMLAGMSESPKLSTMLSICNALDCSLEYIVTGTPENTNNFTLTAEEMDFIEDYRRLTPWGKDLLQTVLKKTLQDSAMELPAKTVESKIIFTNPSNTAKKLGRFAGEHTLTGKRSIQLFELPVSAGPGVYLEEARSESISIPNNEKTVEADYALRISGNSMEPKYHNGDVLLVRNTDYVEIGEPGIFLLDGSGFFKIYGGDRLISLNPDYGPILLKDFSDVQCKGKVIGRLRRKEQS